MKAYYDSWEDDVHSTEGVSCVECHYAPGEQHSIKAKMRGLSQLVSYASDRFGSARVRGHVNNDSCLVCHPTDQEFKTNAIAFPAMTLNTTGDVNTTAHSLRLFTHEKHLGKLDNGQELQCASCHERRAGEKHIATYKESCYLCHFNKKVFNKDEARCMVCHTLPETPIQEKGQNPITHKMLSEANVNCSGCHADTTRGGGPVHKERCRTCHDQAGKLAKWNIVAPHIHDMATSDKPCKVCLTADESKKHMHKTHVVTQVANCFDCHIEMQHGTAGNELDIARQRCSDCHSNSHAETVAILEGKISVGDTILDLRKFDMMKSHTTCVACHNSKKTTEDCKPVMSADNKACQSCHGIDHAVLASWRVKIKNLLEEAADLQKEAHALLSNKEAVIKKEHLKKLRADMSEADSYIEFVKTAGALHNQKAAGKLLNNAMDIFEDTIDAIADDGN